MMMLKIAVRKYFQKSIEKICGIEYNIDGR